MVRVLPLYNGKVKSYFTGVLYKLPETVPVYVPLLHLAHREVSVPAIK